MKKDLSQYRLEDSKEKLESSKLLLDNSKYKDSISRSYYAMFSAARALLATKNLDSSKHSGVISLFNQHFVKTGIIGKGLSRLLSEAQEGREKSDYQDFVIISKEEAQKQFESAEVFVREIEKTLKKVCDESP